MCLLSAVRGVMAGMATRLGDTSAVVAARRIRQSDFSPVASLHPSRGAEMIALGEA
jgi:hypothetical protein